MSVGSGGAGRDGGAARFMTGIALQLYHRLPSWLQSAVVTLRGRRLESWRYGPETERLVELALERESWTPERWASWQGERLAELLHRAATRVPFYRDHWQDRRRRGDRASWELLEHWPVLSKEELRASPRAFVADDRDPRHMLIEHTSGTTGMALTLWWSRETARAWYALFEARWRRWYGVTRHDRWANIGGQLVQPVSRQAPPFWVWNGAMRQLYMSSYHLAPRHVPAYLEALRAYRIRYIYGYASSLYALAVGARQAGVAAPQLAVAVSNAEPLWQHQREAIGAVLGCPVRETYGMSEAVAGASECQHGALHAWPDAGYLEILEQGQPVAGGTTGDLVGTSLLNSDMPLIRYRIGDRGAAADAGSCPCGRRLPRLKFIEGRADDVLLTRDGRPVGRLDPVFKADLPVLEAQIIQEALDRVRVRYVPAAGFGPRDAAAIADGLRARMGDIAVDFESVDRIPRGAGGKFRAVLSHIGKENGERRSDA